MFIHSKLTKDMELTKIQLENERKIQQLQMQAINALWKKVSCMQNQPLTGDGNEGIAGNHLNGDKIIGIEINTFPKNTMS